MEISSDNLKLFQRGRFYLRHDQRELFAYDLIRSVK